jgi:hypothetical protein
MWLASLVQPAVIASKRAANLFMLVSLFGLT